MTAPGQFLLAIDIALLLSSVQAIGRKKPAEAVLNAGDTKIVLQEGVTRRGWDEVVRVLHDDFNIEYLAATEIFENLPVTLEPAVVRSQAEDVVAKLNKAGAVASVVTVDQEKESP
jgi:hypothetical protein